jgi:hypothetical protein
MLEHVANLLRRLFIDRIGDEIASEAQVSFRPPDEEWRNEVARITTPAGGLANSLNVYLVDLRENRRLRSNERVRENKNGAAFETPAPRRVDCHYLISAWSPAQVTPAIDPTLDEHALLVKVATVLANADPLIPAEIYAPADLPSQIAEERFPITLLPVEGFIKLAEFWGTMGASHRWKPVVYLTVTIPLPHEEQRAGTPVTTSIAAVGRIGAPPSSEELYQIGGVVRDPSGGAPPVPVSGAWVELLHGSGSHRIGLTRSDAEGRFVFMRLLAGNYRLRASLAGQGITQRIIRVPAPSGEYDLNF